MPAKAPTLYNPLLGSPYSTTTPLTNPTLF